MTPGDAVPAGLVAAASPVALSLFGHDLTFDLWDVFGVVAQLAFTWRVLHQWVASEREGKSILPLEFWTWSLVGSAFDLAYCLGRRSAVFTAGALVTGTIFARNWWLARRPAGATAERPSARQLVAPIAVGVLLFALVVVESFGENRGAVRFDAHDTFWLVVGFAGTVGWSARFVVQWWASERRGESHLPRAFFQVGLVSCLLLLAYATSQGLWVKVVSFALTVVPYARNLVLLRRHRPPTAPTSGDPAGAAAAAEPAPSDGDDGPVASARAADPA